MTLPEAVLFDMDGTLTDSEQLWFQSEVEVFTKLGRPWTDGDQTEIIGMSMPASTDLLVAKHNLDVTSEELGEMLVSAVVRLGKEQGMPWREGAVQALEMVRDLGIPTAIVTSSTRNFTDLTLAQAPEGTLSVVITGDMGLPGKPDPAPYRAAAEAFGVDIAKCVAFEDSIPGVQSAMASGAATVLIPFQVDVPRYAGLNILDSLENLTRGYLEELMDGR